MECQCPGADAELRECFRICYRESAHPVVAELERRVLGTEFGGSSYTELSQVTTLVELLDIGPGSLLLEIGAGAGWPGLMLARQAECRVVLTDLPIEALSLAQDRAAAARLESVRCVVAAGGSLPFLGGAFDAVSHSDVLCCLLDKPAVLQAGRAVMRPGGRLCFYVIEPADPRTPLPEGVGPVFVAIPRPYRELLAEAGFEAIGQQDVTPEYRETAARWLRETRGLEPELRAVLGGNAVEQRLADQMSDLTAIDGGLLRRTLYSARVPD
jgi:ubiquinone/menaquinone biosynthesis C-methylase UbiE